MTLISGIPPWVQMYFDALVEKTGKKIKDIFPDFSVMVQGGVNFEPYKAKLLETIGKPIDTIELYFIEKHNKVILEAYGCTETAPGLALNTPTHNRPGSVGRMLPGVHLRIENHETGEELGARETGKILVKGDNIMKGYFDDFENTSLAFRHGWYDTGDMGWKDEDGYLWHVGWLKRFVKIGGEMISLIKVEDVWKNCFPAKRNAVWLRYPIRPKGRRSLPPLLMRSMKKRH